MYREMASITVSNVPCPLCGSYAFIDQDPRAGMTLLICGLCGKFR
jgi:hypothetical protein